MARVLVTGGAGFIGSHLVDAHLADGDEVVVLDNLSTGRTQNIAHHMADPRVCFVEGDVEDAAVLREAARDVDLIYHLAAAVGVFEILRRPLRAIRTNLSATDAVLELAAERGTRVVFTSTSEVYGKNDGSALRESDDSIYGATQVTRWLYAVSKSLDEFLALAQYHENGVPVTIVRLFNTTGPRQSGAYGMVLPRFVAQALANEPITVYGTGEQLRCFTNVHDVVRALRALSTCDKSIGRVVNIGQTREVSIAELAHAVKRITGSRSQIQFVPYTQAYGSGFEDMRRRRPDVSLLRSLVGFVPDTSLERTIEQLVQAHLAPESGDARAAVTRRTDLGARQIAPLTRAIPDR